MANKPAPRNWNDIQTVIATGSMALTLVFWNLFAGPDRETFVKRTQEQAAVPPPQPMQTVAPVIEVQTTSQNTTLQGNGPILLGGNAPQTQIIVQTGGRGGGGGGGGGGGAGGGGGGSTRSS